MCLEIPEAIDTIPDHDEQCVLFLATGCNVFETPMVLSQISVIMDTTPERVQQLFVSAVHRMSDGYLQEEALLILAETYDKQLVRATLK